MFNKTKSPAPSPQPRADNGSAIPPLPDLPSPGGSPSAPVRAAASPAPSARRVGRLIVGETGAVEGNVSADYVEVRGRVVGGISGKQVKLIATAYVDGDITAEQMSIDIGAYFQGRVLQGRREAPAPAPAPRPVAHEPAPQVIDMKGPS